MAPKFASREVSAKRPRDYVAIAEPATPSTAQTSGLPQAWRLLQLSRPAEAAAAFSGSLTGESLRERQDAAYGLALADLQLGLPGEADDAARLAPQTDKRSHQLRLSILTAKIFEANDSGHYRQALIDLDLRAAIAPETADLMMVRGWCYFHLQRYEGAQRVFEALAAAGHAGAQGALNEAKGATKVWWSNRPEPYP